MIVDLTILSLILSITMERMVANHSMASIRGCHGPLKFIRLTDDLRVFILKFDILF